MTPWMEDFLNLASRVASENELFSASCGIAEQLGFEYLAYGARAPVPFSTPKFFLQNNYPLAWQQRYAEAGYLALDPTVKHGRTTESPIVWCDEVFLESPDLWREAQDFGLRFGWAQSCLNANNVGGMLTLSRSSNPLTPNELADVEPKLRWLVSVTHISLSKIHIEKIRAQQSIGLTPRDIEVLKWTADGKSAQEISEILNISKHVVDFHIKNSVLKLQTSNKVAAAVRAATLGLLN